ncbi:MAG: YggS family pyridoxal phosphate-dependent enzyme [Gammaproteobacteria bacterium]|nr:YggS family pyridoxal phosphate-dependent enzyme [Gammaproteobacteria bacterium]
MIDIEKNLQEVQAQIASQCQKSRRDPEEVTLLAVSKKKTIEDISTAHQAGQIDFGENYLQEAEQKINKLQYLPIRWHYIGPIQSNKAHRISELFDWVHSVDRYKVAQRLSRFRPADKPPLNVLLQVNIDDEPSKAGIGLADINELADKIAILPRLNLRGLMAIPAIRTDFEKQREPFKKLADALSCLQLKHPYCDTLSMGMSADMNAAIAEGATLVRIGTAIFGARI